MNAADWKNIAGLICIIALPYLSGNLLKPVTKKKEIGQISHMETYLCGFFLVFLIQGVFFTVGYLCLGMSFDNLCEIFGNFCIILSVISVTLFIIRFVIDRKNKENTVYRRELSHYDTVLVVIIVIIAVLIAVRVIGIVGYIRDDYMLPTVRITLNTSTINEYNPLTSMPYRIGLTTSKKIVTLPVYYAFLCRCFDLKPVVLLYVILSLQTVVCSYMSGMLFIRSFIKQREKLFFYSIFFGGVILSGDYFNRSVGGRLLWNGYAGSTITTAVMLPYVMYVVIGCYRSGMARISDILRLALVLFSSLFITGITYGALLISITGAVTIIGCLIAGRKKFEEDGDTNVTIGGK